MAEPLEYTREGAVISSQTEVPVEEQVIEPLPGDWYTPPLATYQPPERTDVGIAFSKGKRLLTGSGEVVLKGFTGEFIKSLGFEEAGDSWINNAYQSGLLMGLDVNELDEQLKGPKTLEDIEDWKGAIAWGVNAVAEQVPNLVTTFAPAIIGTLLARNPMLFAGKAATVGKGIASVGTLATIDFLNTAEVYTDLLMQTGESRPAVAASTGALMSLLDMLAPFAVIGRMKAGPKFAQHFIKKLSDPKSGFAKKLAIAVGTGATEGSTEYVQTMFEGMALNYVEENNLWKEFSEAQKAEQLEAGARGGLIGTLLGIPVAYRSNAAGRAAKKFKRKAAQDIVDKLGSENAVDAQNLPADLQGVSLLPAPAPLSEYAEQVFRSPISDSEFRIFRDTGEVAPQRISQIVTKIVNNEDLDPFEISIRMENAGLIEERLNSIKEKTDATARLIEAAARTKRRNIFSLLNSTRIPFGDLSPLSRLGSRDDLGPLDSLREAQESGMFRAKERADLRERAGKYSDIGKGQKRDFPFSAGSGRQSTLSQEREQAAREESIQLAKRAASLLRQRIAGLLPAPKKPDKEVSVKETELGTVTEKRIPSITTEGILEQESEAADRKFSGLPPAKRTYVENLGWRRTEVRPAQNKDGTPKFRNKEAGTLELISTYESDQYIIEKESPTRGTVWSLIDKETGQRIATADGSSGLIDLVENYAPDLSTSREQARKEREDITTRALAQRESQIGEVQPQKTDKVSFLMKGKIFKRSERGTPLANMLDRFGLAYFPVIQRTDTLTMEDSIEKRPGKSRLYKSSTKKFPATRAQLEKDLNTWRYVDDKVYTIVEDPKVGKDGDITYILQPDSGENIKVVLTKERAKYLKLGIKVPGPLKYGEKNVYVPEAERIAKETKEQELPVDPELRAATEQGSTEETVARRKEFYDMLAKDPEFREDVTEAVVKATFIEPSIEAGGAKKLKVFARKGHKLNFLFPTFKGNLARLAKSKLDDIEAWVDALQKVKARQTRTLPYNIELSVEITSSDRPDAIDSAGNVALVKAIRRTSTEAIIIKRKEWDNALRTAKAQITRILNSRAAAAQDKEKQTARRLVTNLIDSIDPNTGSRPTPQTHEVVLSNKAAEEHNLDRGVAYSWAPYINETHIRVAGQLVKKADVIDIRLAPASRNTSPLVDGRTRKLIKSKGVPKFIPDPASVEAVYVEPMTGAFVVKRMGGDEREGLSSDNQIDVYLYYNNREDHNAKLSSLRDELVTLSRSLDKTPRVETVTLDKFTDALGRPRTITDNEGKQRKVIFSEKKKQIEKIVESYKKNVDILSSRYVPKVTVKLIPSVYQKILKQSGLEGLQNDFRVLPRKSRKGTLHVKVRDGSVVLINTNSIAEINSETISFDDKFIDSLLAGYKYEEAVQQGPQKGFNLIGSFKDVGNVEKFDDFMSQLLGSKAGMLDEKVQEAMRARRKALAKHVGKMAVFEMADGSYVAGRIERANDKFVGLKKDGKLFGLSSSYTRVQIVEEPSTYVAKEVPVEDIGRPRNMVIRTPVYEKIGDTTQRIPPDREIDLGPASVDVYYRKTTNDFSINVDGVREKEGIPVTHAVSFLNDLIEMTDGYVNIRRVPSNIQRVTDKISVRKDGTARVVVKYVIGKEIKETPPVPTGRVIKRSDIVKEKNKKTADKVKADEKQINKIKEVYEQTVAANKKPTPVGNGSKARNSKVASKNTRAFEEVKDTPFKSIPTNQKFKDEYGGTWKVMEHVGTNTLLSFVGGTTPDITFQVTWNGKKAEGKFEKNFVVTVKGSSTPSTMQVKGDNKRFHNYSIVNPIPADGTGSIKYNTGLTPKRFREILGPKIGMLNINRLIQKGLIKIVQSQQDVPNAPLDLGVKATPREGQLIFITNNIKEEEVIDVFVHEVGVHLGLKEIYGLSFDGLISQVKLRRKDKAWESAFENAEIVADQFSFADDIARDNFIAEEALAYFVESNNNFKESIWQSILDFISRWIARTKMWLGGKVSDNQLISFARGAVRGMSERNFQDALYSTSEQNYSIVQDFIDPIVDKVGERLKEYDAANSTDHVKKSSAIWKATKKFFDPFVNMPFARDFRKLRSLLHGKLGEIEDIGKDILKAYDGLNEEANAELFRFFTTKNAVIDEDIITDSDLRNASVALKRKIEEIADEAMLREMFPEASKEQLEELRGAYLPSVYLKYILSAADSLPGRSKMGNRTWTLSRKDFDDELKEMMGQVKDVRYLLYRAITIPQQDMAIHDYLQQLSVRQAVIETQALRTLNRSLEEKELALSETEDDATRSTLKAEIKDIKKQIKNMPRNEKYVSGDVPWILPNQWITVQYEDRKVRTTLASIQRQIESYQAVLENGDRILSDTGREKIRERIATLDLARKEFYDSIGVEDGNTQGLSTYYNENFDIHMFQKIPNHEKYGAMAGLYVRKEIHADLVGNADMVVGEANLFQRMFLPYGTHARLVSAFKLLKVPLNPPTVVRNFVSNMVLMQLVGGVPFHRQPALMRAAIREMRGEDSGLPPIIDSKTGRAISAYEIAKLAGVSASTLTGAELRKMETVFKHMEKEGVWSILTRGKKAWNKLAEFGGDMYQNIEIMGKVMVIRDMLQNQRDHLEQLLRKENSDILTIEDIAVQEANRVLFDYSEVHPVVRGARSSFLGAPFITFQVKVLPQLLKTLYEHPTRFIPYFLMLGSMQALFMTLPFVYDDWDKMEKLLAENIRDGSPVFLPWKDSNGLYQAVDLSYFFPWTFYTETAQKLGRGEVRKALVEGGIVGPAWQTVSALLFGKDPFTNYPIVNKTDATSDKIFDILSFVGSTALPPWLTRNGLVSLSSLGEAAYRIDPREIEGKLTDYLLDRENRYGDPRRSLEGVLGYMLGLNPYAVSPQARSRQAKRYTSEMDSLDRELSSLQKNRRLSREEKERKRNAIRDRIDQLREERSQFIKDTSGIGRAL